MEYFLNADTGNDSNTGTSASPWLTISKFVSSSSTGDTCTLQTSTANYTFATQNFGSKQYTIRGADKPSWTPTGWEGAKLVGASAVTWNTFADGTVFKNLIVKDSFNTTNIPMFNPSAVNWRFETSVFHDLTINNTSDEGPCMRVPPGATLTVVGCVAYNFTGGYLISGRNNVLAGTLNFYNNIIDSVGVWLATRGQGLTANLTNNIFYTQTNPLTFDSEVAATITYTNKNNCIYDDTFWAGEPSFSGNGNITSDPLFVDAANHDYRLQRTSPCRNTGTGSL